MLNDLVRIKELLDAQAIAGRAGPGRVVEGKQLWLKLAQCVAALSAGVFCGKYVLITFDVFIAIHWGHKGYAIGKSQGSLKAFGKPLLETGLHFEAVNHNVDLVFALFVERWHIIDVIHNAVDA